MLIDLPSAIIAGAVFGGTVLFGALAFLAAWGAKDGERGARRDR